jgi:hypothetical protein
MPDQAPSAPEYVRTEEWTYIGQRLVKGKLLHVWKDPNGKEAGYKDLVGDPRPVPGAVFLFSITADDRFGVKGKGAPKYLRVHEDGEQVARWRLLHEADRAQHRERTAAKADMGENPLNELLRPIKEEYERRNWEGKAALIGVVIRFITGGRI